MLDNAKSDVMRQEHTTLDGVTKQQLLTKVVELLGGEPTSYHASEVDNNEGKRPKHFLTFC